MLRLFPKSVLVLTVLAGFTGTAFAEQTTFENPRYKNLALDWCKSWAADCGKPAADAWCVKQGYESATKFSRWDDIGEPTRIISNNQICDQPDCDSFAKITCQKADADDGGGETEEVTYKKPMAGGRRLDWCLTWAEGCGQPAADYYCKQKGHAGAKAFFIAENIGKTRIMKTGEKCSQPDCDGFKYITCE